MTEENKNEDFGSVVEEKSNKIKDFLKRNKVVLIEAGVIAAAIGVYATVSAFSEENKNSDEENSIEGLNQIEQDGDPSII